jgi:hypothetical protein
VHHSKVILRACIARSRRFAVPFKSFGEVLLQTARAVVVVVVAAAAAAVFLAVKEA